MKKELGGYETRLLAELTEVVSRRTESRRSWFTMPKLAMGGVALAALAVTAGLTLPVFGGASERSPNTDAATATPDPREVEPVGFSLAVDDDEVTVTIDDIKDDAGLEAALKAEGIGSNVTYLPGAPESCEWPAYEVPELEGLAVTETEEGAMTFKVLRSDFAHGEVLLVAVHETDEGDSSQVSGLSVRVSAATSDPGECVAVD